MGSERGPVGQAPASARDPIFETYLNSSELKPALGGAKVATAAPGKSQPPIPPSAEPTGTAVAAHVSSPAGAAKQEGQKPAAVGNASDKAVQGGEGSADKGAALASASPGSTSNLKSSREASDAALAARDSGTDADVEEGATEEDSTPRRDESGRGGGGGGARARKGAE